ncbi:hypothetical protein [Streptomyces sp. NPDC006012]|uniref:hypothetical protein n=1 Tax=Streptomyces sp. NPDC006012 TaxID=3364739 RepID=UPI00368F3C07
MYVVGGADATGGQVTGVQQPPGYGDCAVSGVAGWLSAPHSVTVAPGVTVQVPVTLDAAEAGPAGTCTSGLTAVTDSPHAVPAPAATMRVTGRH